VITVKPNYDPYHLFVPEGEAVLIVGPEMLDDCLQSSACEIIVLDCGFEGERGLALLQKVKVCQPGIPVIFLTDETSDEITAKALKTGARDFYKGPMNVFEIRDSIKRILKLKRSSRERRVPFTAYAKDAVMTSLQTNGTPTNIVRAIRYIEGNLSDNLTLPSLAREANLSEYHFCRIFKRYTGANPMKFVAHLRIERAKELLKRDDMNVSDVAVEVGFNDMSNFVKQFKKRTGTTPSAYRASVREPSSRRSRRAANN
jgi:AraC-like DNA-binding protein/CheY-like chemotaxis protein